MALPHGALYWLSERTKEAKGDGDFMRLWVTSSWLGERPDRIPGMFSTMLERGLFVHAFCWYRMARGEQVDGIEFLDGF